MAAAATARMIHQVTTTAAQPAEMALTIRQGMTTAAMAQMTAAVDVIAVAVVDEAATTSSGLAQG